MTDDCADWVSRADRIVQTFEDNGSNAFSSSVSRATVIKGIAFSIRVENTLGIKSASATDEYETELAPTEASSLVSLHQGSILDLSHPRGPCQILLYGDFDMLGAGQPSSQSIQCLVS